MKLATVLLQLSVSTHLFSYFTIHLAFVLIPLVNPWAERGIGCVENNVVCRCTSAAVISKKFSSRTYQSLRFIIIILKCADFIENGLGDLKQLVWWTADTAKRNFCSIGVVRPVVTHPPSTRIARVASSFLENEIALHVVLIDFDGKGSN